MKRVILFLMLSTPAFCFAQFRETKWGMTKSDVSSNENGEVISKKGDMWMFDGKIGSYDVITIYRFSGDALYSGGYLLHEDYVNKNNYIFTFEDLKEKLTLKYGDPIKDDKIWKNSLYKDRPDDYGMAVSAGHLVYITQWLKDDTLISLVLRGEKFDCTLGLTYESMESIREKETEVPDGL